MPQAPRTWLMAGYQTRCPTAAAPCVDAGRGAGARRRRRCRRAACVEVRPRTRGLERAPVPGRRGGPGGRRPALDRVPGRGPLHARHDRGRAHRGAAPARCRAAGNPDHRQPPRTCASAPSARASGRCSRSRSKTVRLSTASARLWRWPKAISGAVDPVRPLSLRHEKQENRFHARETAPPNPSALPPGYPLWRASECCPA